MKKYNFQDTLSETGKENLAQYYYELIKLCNINIQKGKKDKKKYKKKIKKLTSKTDTKNYQNQIKKLRRKNEKT